MKPKSSRRQEPGPGFIPESANGRSASGLTQANHYGTHLRLILCPTCKQGDNSDLARRPPHAGGARTNKRTERPAVAEKLCVALLVVVCLSACAAERTLPPEFRSEVNEVVVQFCGERIRPGRTFEI